jgi:hypothetical protein
MRVCVYVFVWNNTNNTSHPQHNGTHRDICVTFFSHCCYTVGTHQVQCLAVCEEQQLVLSVSGGALVLLHSTRKDGVLLRQVVRVVMIVCVMMSLDVRMVLW